MTILQVMIEKVVCRSIYS